MDRAVAVLIAVVTVMVLVPGVVALLVSPFWAWTTAIVVVSLFYGVGVLANFEVRWNDDEPVWDCVWKSAVWFLTFEGEDGGE